MSRNFSTLPQCHVADISGILESDGFVEKLADCDESELSDAHESSKSVFHDDDDDDGVLLQDSIVYSDGSETVLVTDTFPVEGYGQLQCNKRFLQENVDLRVVYRV